MKYRPAGYRRGLPALLAVNAGASLAGNDSRPASSTNSDIFRFISCRSFGGGRQVMHVDVIAAVSLQNVDGSTFMLDVTRTDPEEETAADELFFQVLQVFAFDQPVEQRAERCPAGASNNDGGHGSRDGAPGCNDRSAVATAPM